MGHGHHHHHSSEKNIGVAFFLNLSFTVIEFVGGWFTNSMAIMSDAFHDLGDSIGLALSWYFEKLSKRGRTKTFSYGYKRFSLLAAIVNSLILLAGSITIVVHTIPRLIQPVPTDGRGMFFLSILGILINGAAAFKVRKGANLNQRTVFLHLIEDVLGWVAVLVGGVIIWQTGLYIVDPILTIAITGYMLYNVFKVLKDGIIIFLQGAPQSTSEEMISNRLAEVEEIIGIHDFHAWSLDGEHAVITLHLVLNKNYTLQEQAHLKLRVKDLLELPEQSHITLEFESEEEDCHLRDC